MSQFSLLLNGSTELVRNMATTHADFMRLLPVATEGRHYKIDGAEILIAVDGGKQVTISLGMQGAHCIGPTVALPLTAVRYSFCGMTRQEIETFLAGFDRYYQRGGG